VSAPAFCIPYMKLRLAGTVNHAKDVILKQLNVEHRTFNIEHPILMALRFIYFKQTAAY
jgi:DNA-directed RNA polymerase subunit L